mgnify:CR=1 FL=1
MKAIHPLPPNDQFLINYWLGREHTAQNDWPITIAATAAEFQRISVKQRLILQERFDKEVGPVLVRSGYANHKIRSSKRRRVKA